MFAVLVFLAISNSLVGAINPNPCAAVVAPNTRLVRDFAACDTLFFCNGPVGTPTLPCETGRIFSETHQGCIPGTTCTDVCPATGILAVAVADDAACRKYQFCVDNTRVEKEYECSETHRFNRITGLCALRSQVPCFAPQPPPGDVCKNDDDTNITGFVGAGTDCVSFQFCNDGVLDEERGIMSCTPDHFNPAIGNCDAPGNLNPRCIPYDRQ